MTFYKVITAAYVNEVIVRLLMHIMALRGSEVTDLTEGSSNHVCAEASIMRFNSSALVFGYSAYTRDFSPKELRQVTSAALLPKPTVLKMLTEKCSYLSTIMRGCAILLQA
jgi:hypothetical protein